MRLNRREKRLLLDGEIAEERQVGIGLIDCHGRQEGRFDEIWMDGIGERRDLPRGRDGADKSNFGLV